MLQVSLTITITSYVFITFWKHTTILQLALRLSYIYLQLIAGNTSVFFFILSDFKKELQKVALANCVYDRKRLITMYTVSIYTTAVTTGSVYLNESFLVILDFLLQFLHMVYLLMERHQIFWNLVLLQYTYKMALALKKTIL